MKRTLTALTVAASLIAGGASAFDLNITLTEQLEMTGKRMVGDLTVGVKALIRNYSLNCKLDGKMHLISATEIVTDPSNYQIILRNTAGNRWRVHHDVWPSEERRQKLPFSPTINVLMF